MPNETSCARLEEIEDACTCGRCDLRNGVIDALDRIIGALLESHPERNPGLIALACCEGFLDATISAVMRGTANRPADALRMVDDLAEHMKVRARDVTSAVYGEVEANKPMTRH